MKTARTRAAALIVILATVCVFAHADLIELSLTRAESQALETSWRLKGAESDVETAGEQLKAGYAALFPRLTFQANYTYLTSLPELQVAPSAAPITFGAHNNFSLGPVLTYTLWDSFSSLKSYRALTKLEEARKQDRENTKTQLLFTVRSTYIRVQLALEELRVVNASLELAKAQGSDIQNRMNAGAATRMESVIARRHVLSFKIQRQAQQSALTAALKDLLSAIADKSEVDAAKTIIHLDSLAETLNQLTQVAIEAPSDEQPQVKKQELLAQSAELAAAAQKAKVFPTLQLMASSTLAYPNGPQPEVFNQNSIGLSLVVPLYLGDPNWHLALQKQSEARSARYTARQIRGDIDRDYNKARELLEQLRAQRALASADVADSQEVANLYYSSYNAGKSKLIDVQSANNEALKAKVNALRIDAQMASQLVSLIAMSAKEVK